MEQAKILLKSLVLLVLTVVIILGVRLNFVYAIDTISIGGYNVTSATGLADVRI